MKPIQKEYIEQALLGKHLTNMEHDWDLFVN